VKEGISEADPHPSYFKH